MRSCAAGFAERMPQLSRLRVGHPPFGAVERCIPRDGKTGRDGRFATSPRCRDSLPAAGATMRQAHPTLAEWIGESKRELRPMGADTV